MINGYMDQVGSDVPALLFITIMHQPCLLLMMEDNGESCGLLSCLPIRLYLICLDLLITRNGCLVGQDLWEVVKDGCRDTI